MSRWRSWLPGKKSSKQVTELSHEPEEMLKQFQPTLESLQKMQKLNSAEMTSTVIEANLKSLYELKDEVIKAKFSPQVWPERFLSYPVIAEFLVCVINNIKRKNLTELTSLIRNIVNPIDLTYLKPDKKCIIQEIFCNKENFMITDLPLSSENILDYFSIVKSVFSVLSPRPPKMLLNIKQNLQSFIYVEQLTNYYKNYMKTTKQKHDILLVDTLLIMLGYNPDKNKFEASYEGDIQYVSSHLDYYVKEYFKIPMECTTKRESMIISSGIILALDHPRKCEMISSVNSHIHYIKKQLREFSPQISNVLEHFCTSESYDLQKILETLNTEKLNAIDFEKINNSNCDSNNLHNNTTSVTANFSNMPLSANLQNMLQYFKLMETYLEKKLTFRDALLIRHEISETKIEPTDLPFVIMGKIMACDEKCRTNIIHCRIPKNKYYIYDSEPPEGSEDEFYIIHPLDIIILLLHCSDNFLRYELFSKLFSCQMAVPLLLPDGIKNSITLLLWALRSIKKSWKAVDSQGKVHPKCYSIVDYEGPIISFVKCGKLLSRSKSELLNKVICDDHANIFFHWNLLEEQNCCKIISQGLVELCCYYPSKKHAIFKDAVIFTNLHGDARQHPKQVAFLQKISFISCILMRMNDLGVKEYADVLKSLANSRGGIIVILIDTKSYDENRLKSIINSEAVSVVCLKNRTMAKIQSDIRNLISKKIETCSSQFVSIANSTDIAHKQGIQIDEDNEHCVLGKKEALHMKEVINQVEFIKMKNQLLPLQGPEMWQKWAAHEKEFHRHKERKHLPPIEYKVTKEQDKDKIRYTQLAYITNNNPSPSPLTMLFLQNITWLEKDCKVYFLHWLNMILDNLSKDMLEGLQIEYQNIRSEIENVSNTDSYRSKELIELSKSQNLKLINISIGMQHFFREIGQIYETVEFKHIHEPAKSLVNFHSNAISKLPKIAAETLEAGFAMEIMDGEASHVPLTWVQAVIRCLQRSYPGKKLFVLSILGVQSSGKSTLLNTMFGLRFNVSIARCTRGAFIQLLHLDEELKKELHCDFILVVDTEGICAPELVMEGSEQHDNELATFVIGLADVTIINIYGETPANLSDILQTVLHAFVRMKEVDKNPGCLFVHQNVTEQFASERLQPGRQILLDQLNKLTKAVAKIEHCETNYVKFQDVIKFDVEKDVHCFSSLWKGDPPMAPINVGYSECAQDLKSTVLKAIKNHQKLCTFDTFEKKIQNLWTAILKENFVFNFKNTMEVAAYNELDLQFGEVCWKLQECLEKQLLLCENKIKSSSQDVIESIKKSCINDSIKILNKTCDEYCKELSNFVARHDLANIMSKWDFHIKERLNEKKDIFLNTLKQHCERLVHKKENDRKTEELQQKYEEKIRDEITELVSQIGIHKTADSLEISKMFDDNWSKWMTKLAENVTYLEYTSEQDIDRYIENSLGNHFAADYSRFLQKLEKYHVNKTTDSILLMPINNKKHITITRSFFNPSTLINYYWSYDTLYVEAQNETNHILEKMRTWVESIINTSTEGVTQSLTDRLLKKLFTNITCFNDSSEAYSVTLEYKIDIALVVCSYAKKEFKQWTSKLKEQNDPILALQQQKSKFLTIFTNKYLKVAAEIAAAKELCSSLINSIATTVVNKLHVNLVSYLKTTNGNFNSKPGFKVQILSDLAKQESFVAYKVFLVNSNISYEQWAEKYIVNLCNSENDTEKSPFVELAIKEIDQLVFTVTKAINAANISNSTEWLNDFCSAIDGVIEIKKHNWVEDVKCVSDNMHSIKYFVENLKEELNSDHSSKAMLNQCQSKCSAICKAAGSLLFDSVIKKTCTAQCPFCREQCDIINSDHLQHDPPKLHHVQIHRPQCVNGRTWYKTNKLVLHVCNSLMDDKYELVLLNKDPTGNTTIPYKDYQKEYPEWSIPEEIIVDPPMYWMWFVSRFYKELVSWSGAVETDIPQRWKEISNLKALDSLAKTYGLHYSKDIFDK